MGSELIEKQHAADDNETEENPKPAGETERIEEKIDRDLRDSFPASDPPGWTMGVREKRDNKDKT